MTLLSVYVATVAIGFSVPGLDVQVQFKHSNYECPYVIITTPWWRFIADRRGGAFCKSDRGKPPVYTTIKRWGLGYPGRRQAS